jgi:MoxR-like ATPase
MASRAEAMLNGRSYVIPQDVKRVAHDILRHRILLNYEAEAEGMNADKIITEIINDIPIP